MQQGIAFLGDYKCPFCYDDETEKITLYLGNDSITLPDGKDEIVGQKLGVMAGGYLLYKLSVPLSNSTMMDDGDGLRPVSSGNQINPVEYYIEDFCSRTLYTEMKFHFPELDHFIPSASRMRISKGDIVFTIGMETVYCFEIQYADTRVTVSFNLKVKSHKNNGGYAETLSEVSLKFPETGDVNYLTGLYYGVRAFFCFICNRKNIGLRGATLIGERSYNPPLEEKLETAIKRTKQKIIYSQKYLEPQEDEKKVKNVPPSGLFSDRLKELFQLFFEESCGEEPLVNCSSVHRSFKYRNLIDLEQSLNITAAFEFYMRTILPEISSKKSYEFYNDMQVLLDEYIKKKSGDLRKKAKGLKKSLKPEVSLEEKIKKAYDGYASWAPLGPILSDWFGEDVSELAEAAGLWRNDLAHEKREYMPDEHTIVAIRLVEHLNYCIILRKAGYADDKIKAIVSTVLTQF